MGFLQYSDRLASLKFRVKSGKVGIISAYAPHNLKPYDERRRFYMELGKLLDKTSVNGSKYILGDLNAKIGQRRAAEENALGPHCYGTEAVHGVESPNRELLMEFCTDYGYLVGNTFFETSAEKKVTFFVPGASPLGVVNEHSYHMMDLALAPEQALGELADIHSVREASLATDHFLVLCHLRCEFSSSTRKPANGRPDRKSLSESVVEKRFVENFKQQYLSCLPPRDFKDFACACKKAEKVLPHKLSVANKPWISEHTMFLISQRQAARHNNDYEQEKLIHKLVRTSARQERSGVCFQKS